MPAGNGCSVLPAARNGGIAVSSIPTGWPNLFVQLSPGEPSAAFFTVKMNAPPSVLLPPRAFQYLSAIGQNRLSSAAMLFRVASMACFSEQISPICTPLSSIAKTCGRSMAVSVMPINWNCSLYTSLRAMMKNQGPSGEVWTWFCWIAR